MKKEFFVRLASVLTAIVLTLSTMFVALPSIVHAADFLPTTWQYMDTYLKRDDIVEPDKYQSVVSTTDGIYSERLMNPDRQSEENFERQKETNSVHMSYSSPTDVYYKEEGDNFLVSYDLYYYGSWLKDGREGATITLQLPVPVKCDPDSAKLITVWGADEKFYADDTAHNNISEIPFSKSESFITVTVPYFNDWEKEAENKWAPGTLQVSLSVVYHRNMDGETGEDPKADPAVDISNAVIAAIADQVYTGKAITPKASVTYNGETLVLNTDYTVAYENNKNAGKATIIIKGKGKYNGKLKKTFYIRPKATKLTSVKNTAKKTVTVKWAKANSGTGYQIQYSLKKNFKSGNKTKLVKQLKTASTKITSLKKGKTYYFRIRVYKTAGSKKIYSSWSAAKKVKIVK